MNQDEILLEEWKEVRTSLRHFGSKRFAQLTVFIAAAGFMFAELLKPAAPHPAVRVLGIVFPLLFLLMEISSVRYFRAFAKRGEEIEGQLCQLKLMTVARPKSDLATWSICTLYGLVSLIWAGTTLADYLY